MEKPTNQACPGCEQEFIPGDVVVVYFCVNWHEACAREDKRVNDCMDAEDKYRYEFDE